jgi:hypothetical protein
MGVKAKAPVSSFFPKIPIAKQGIIIIQFNTFGIVPVHLMEVSLNGAGAKGGKEI